MNDAFPYTFLLKIANIPIILHLRTRHDLKILEEKYKDYVVSFAAKPSPKYHIYLETGNLKSSTYLLAQNYYITIDSLEKEFLMFNDLFRKLFCNILSKEGGFIFHASSLIKNNKGYVFVGKKGSGKSTVRKLFPKFACLGDDSAIIRKSGRKYYLYGSPFYQKTNRSYPNIKVPIALILFLNKAKFDFLANSAHPQNLPLTLSNIFYSGIENNLSEVKTIYEIIQDFCNKENFANLYFQLHTKFWHLIDNSEDIKLGNKARNAILASINPLVKKILPSDITWSSALAPIEFLKHCKVINETSWNFEFSGERSIPKIARLTFSQNLRSPHANYIREIKENSKINNSSWPVMLQNKSKFTIIDGNHHLVALYQLWKKRKSKKCLKILTGQIEKSGDCLLF